MHMPGQKQEAAHQRCSLASIASQLHDHGTGQLGLYLTPLSQLCDGRCKQCSTNLPEPEPELRFLPEKKMQQFRRITGAVEGVMLPPRVVQIDDEGRVVPPR